MRITFDSNCLISLKNHDGEYNEIRALVNMHADPIVVCIPAIAASENQQGGTLHTNFAQFQQFLTEIGCGRCELLNPMGCWDISYWGHAIYSNDQMVSVERKIHTILFPDIPFEYSEYCRRFGVNSGDGTVDRRWRRAKCDVQAMWCHMYYDDDIFVTQDDNFRKATKKTRLIAMGAREILKPSECLSKLKTATDM